MRAWAATPVCFQLDGAVFDGKFVMEYLMCTMEHPIRIALLLYGHMAAEERLIRCD